MEQLGIDWKILIGQIVNFAILLYLLKRFAYKPFFGILEKRRSQIAEGVRKSEEAEKSLLGIREMEGEIRKKGEERAREIIKAAEARAQGRAEELISLAEQEKEKIAKKAKESAQKELEEGKRMGEKEALNVLFLLSEKFLKEKFDGSKDKKFIEEITSSLK